MKNFFPHINFWVLCFLRSDVDEQGHRLSFFHTISIYFFNVKSFDDTG